MCEKCIRMELDGESFYCKDCGNDISIWGIAEWFMVSDKVWEASGAGKEDDLCVGCLEKRMGRKLSPDDFGGPGGFFPVNKIFEHSPRLRNRLGKTREMDTVDGLVLDLLRSMRAKKLRKEIEAKDDLMPTDGQGYGGEATHA